MTDALEKLSAREREVFHLIVEGKTTKEVAAHLGVSHKTVETYRTRFNRKLDIHSVIQLSRFAVEHGYMKPTPPQMIAPQTKSEVYMAGWTDGVTEKVRTYPTSWSIYDTSIYQAGRGVGINVLAKARAEAATCKGEVGKP